MISLHSCWSTWLQQWSGGDLHYRVVLFCNVDCWLELGGGGNGLYFMNITLRRGVNEKRQQKSLHITYWPTDRKPLCSGGLDSTCWRAQLGGAGACPSPASSPQCVDGIGRIDSGSIMGGMGLVDMVMENVSLHANSQVPQSMALQWRSWKVE